MMNEELQLLEIIGRARARPAPIAATGLDWGWGLGIYLHQASVNDHTLIIQAFKTGAAWPTGTPGNCPGGP